MKTEDETSNKLDMSLDEIIKLDKKEARKSKQVQQTLAIRGRRRNASQYRQKSRKSAAATRLRGLKQKRLSLTNRSIQGSSSQPQVLAKNKRVFATKNVRPSRSVAQAVLRRAQRTAAAAARAAAEATALLQSNRIRRQQLFDERRSIQPTSRIAYERRPSRRRSAPVPTVGSRGAYNVPQVTGRSWQSEQQSHSFQRPRRRSLQILGSPQGRRTSFRGTVRRNNSLRINTFVRNQRWVQRTAFRSNSRGRQRNGYTLTATGRPASRARDAEYLAQARALIQAQNENAHRYNLDNQNTSVWTPRSYSAPQRNLNYYAKYWDN